MQTWLGQHSWLVLLAYMAILFPAVSLLVSWISGWSTLARQFRAESEFTGSRWTAQTGRMRWLATYGSCLTIGADASGLYLAVSLLYRFRHPPLFVPWQEITVSETRPFGFERVQFRLGREPGIPLTLQKSIAAELAGAAGKSWPGESKQ